MGDRARGSTPGAGNLSQYITSHPGWLSLATPLWLDAMSEPTNKQTPPKTSNVLRYATTFGENDLIARIKPNLSLLATTLVAWLTGCDINVNRWAGDSHYAARVSDCAWPTVHNDVFGNRCPSSPSLLEKEQQHVVQRHICHGTSRKQRHRRPNV